MYISNIFIKNIKCFGELSLSLEKDGAPCLWNVILGDNSTGKTSLLRCIAIGLCDPPSGAALMKELSGEFIRENEKSGLIVITIKDYHSGDKYIIKTELIQEGGVETINQSIDGNREKLTENLFICGYGIQRSGEADASHEAYSSLESVYTLFNYYASLQNPELVLLRQTREKSIGIIEAILRILMLGDKFTVDLTSKGIQIVSPGSRTGFSSWGDGYSSTFTWLMDFIGWQIYADRFEESVDMKSLRGIVMIDEIELNLHPRLQRFLIKNLKDQFPNVQFIATSHSPIIATGLTDYDDAKLIAFIEDAGSIRAMDDLPAFHGMRADQVLTSVAFGLHTTISIGSIKEIDRFSELIGKSYRRSNEEAEYQKLRAHLNTALSGETETERIVEKAVDAALEDLLKQKPSEDLKLLVNQKLRKLFQPTKEKDLLIYTEEEDLPIIEVVEVEEQRNYSKSED